MAADVIVGGAGGDTLLGLAGADNIDGGNGANYIDGGAGNDTLAGGTGADTVLGGEGADEITGAAGDDSLDGGAGADNISGGADDDAITAGEGADTVDGGLGEDTIDLTEASSAADVVVINSDLTNSDSTRVQVAGDNNDTGEDVITAFNFTNDTIQIVGTNVIGFVHGTDTAIGTATGDVDDGTVGSFATSVGLIELDSQTTDGNWDDAGDIALTFVSPSASLTESRFEAVLEYDITGTAAANTITTGAGDDFITGGASADVLTGGAGADTFRGFTAEDQSIVASANTLTAPGIAAADTITFATTSAGNVDVIADFTSGTDKLDVTTAATAPTTLIGVGTATALTDGTGYVLYGQYVAATGVFTVAAAFGAGTDDDALFVEGDGTETAVTETDYVVLTGLNQALVSSDFI